MLNTDPTFRSVIANLEKASTGAELRKALADYDETRDPGAPGIDPVRPDPLEPPEEKKPLNTGGWSGALVTLYASHFVNVRDHSDLSWFIPPGPPAPGEKIIDWDPDDPANEYIDQDGNPVDINS